MLPLTPRILIVKTSSLGDVIHALPVVSDIARALPGAIIDWVVEESFADIPRLHPAVNQIFTSALRRWKRSLLSAESRREVAQFRRALKAQPYDLILDLQGLIKSAWIARQANGPIAGFDRHSAREGLASWAYQQKFSVSRDLHAVRRNRALAAAALSYSLDTLALDYGITAAGLATEISPPVNLPLNRDSLQSQKNTSNATFAILMTATSRDDKLWPEAHWIALGQQLQARGLRALLPAGNANERARAERIAAAIPESTVLPPAAIASLAQTFSGKALAIGVDTGLTHLTCALNVPTIALYTATDPGLTGVMGCAFFQNLGGKNVPPTVDAVLSAAQQALG